MKRIFLVGILAGSVAGGALFGLWLAGNTLLKPETQPVAVSADLGETRSGQTGKKAETGVGGTPSPAVTPVPSPQVTPTGAETQKPFVIITTGDMMLGRGVEHYLGKMKEDYIYPFEKAAGILKEGDLVVGNLEAPVTSSTKGLDSRKKIVLKDRVEAMEGIRYAGFSLLSLANNHILDYYDRGLTDTMKLLDESGISHAGAGKNLDEARKPAILEVKGMKVGMLAYTDMADILYAGRPPIRFAAQKDKPGVAPLKAESILEDIQKLRSQVDILIVSLHWGVEDTNDCTPAQVEFAHKLLDQGVDILYGHHPHHFQGIEIYKGKPIIYSHGNFLFDQNDPFNQESFILKMEYENARLKNLTAIPIRTIGKTQVVPQEGQGAAALLKRLSEQSARVNTRCTVLQDRAVFLPD